MSAFAAEVEARARGRRVRLDVLWDAFGVAAPVDAAAVDARRRLAEAIDEGARAGAWSVSKQLDTTGRTPLPAFVLLPAAERAERADPSQFAWLPELAWAASLRRISPTHLRMLRQVNAFLRDDGPSRPVVPSEERSLELFDDEKAISGRVGGRTLWAPGRLTCELLRCTPSTTPFAYERVGDGDRLLVVENQATFATLRNLLRAEDGHGYAAVVFGSGRSAATTIGYLTELPFPVAGIDYFGDLDVDGLEAAAACLSAARALGVDARMHRRLWQLLLEQPPTVAVNAPSDARVGRAVAVMPAGLRGRAAAVLADGQRIAQERCGYERLLATPGWWRG